MILKYLFVVSLFLKFGRSAIFLEEDKPDSNCDKIVGEIQKILQRISDNFEKHVEENQKISERISNLEISCNKLEAKEEHFKTTLIEENKKILQSISNLEVSSNKFKEEHLNKTENRKLLQNILDTLDISNRNLESKEEHLINVFEAFDESIKKRMEIADDESVESFLIKHQLLLNQMMKEMMARQERSSPITTTKIEEIYTENNSVEETTPNISSENGSIVSTDCSDLLALGVTESGFYFIYIFKSNGPKQVKVYCDMETDGGGWTVFLQRIKASNSVNFTKEWDSYKNGFGNEEEFWLGNEVLHAMTNNRNYSLRVDTKDIDGRETWGVWISFVVHSEDKKYSLMATGYNTNSTALDSFIYYTNNSFSTYDVDNDKDSRNCAQDFRGGWWYNNCYKMNPTGQHALIIYPWSNSDGGTRIATWLQLKIRPLQLN